MVEVGEAPSLGWPLPLPGLDASLVTGRARPKPAVPGTAGPMVVSCEHVLVLAREDSCGRVGRAQTHKAGGAEREGTLRLPTPSLHGSLRHAQGTMLSHAYVSVRAG
jgi:hypothetical protein